MAVAVLEDSYAQSATVKVRRERLLVACSTSEMQASIG